MSYKSLEDSVFHKEWKEEVKKEFDRVVSILKPDVEFEETGFSDWFGGHSSIVPLLTNRERVVQGKTFSVEVFRQLGLPESKENLFNPEVSGFSPTFHTEIEKVMKKHPCKVVLIDHLGAVV